MLRDRQGPGTAPAASRTPLTIGPIRSTPDTSARQGSGYGAAPSGGDT